MQSKPLKSNPLEQLSTEELERLLRTPEGETPDVAFIMEVMEVIQSREADAKGPDVDQAWQEFRQEYMDRPDLTVIETPGFRTRKRTSGASFRLLRRMAVVAAVVVLFSATASSFGLFQVFARWSAQTFRFGTSLSLSVADQAVMDNDPFTDLRSAVAQSEQNAVIPVWAPKGTVQVGAVERSEDGENIDFLAGYTSDDGEFTIYISISEENEEFDGATYEKYGSRTQVEEINGIQHYLINNVDTCDVIWATENVRCLIQGDIPMEDMNQMIESIYWEK